MNAIPEVPFQVPDNNFVWEFHIGIPCKVWGYNFRPGVIVEELTDTHVRGYYLSKEGKKTDIYFNTKRYKYGFRLLKDQRYYFSDIGKTHN